MQTAAGASLNDADHVPAGSRRGLILAVAVLTVVVLVVDQVTKAVAVARLSPGEIIPVLGDLLRLQITRNAGAAFSVGTGMTWLLTVVALTIVVVVVRSARRLGSRAWAVTLGLLLGGALGNLVDRLVREPGLGRGHVVDFIAYGHLFIGNVADIAIVAAAAGMAVLSVRGIGLDGARAAARPAREQPEPGTTDQGADQ